MAAAALSEMEKLSLLDRAYFEAFRPPPEMSVAEWVEEYRVLNSKAGAALAGKFRLENAPYVREPLEAFTDGRVVTIVLMWGAQTGKTDGVLFNMMMYASDCDPGNMLFVLPDQKSVKKFVKGRLKPTIEANPRVRRHLSEKKTAVGLDAIEFDHCQIFMGLAGSLASQASMPCRYVFIDETDNVAKAVKNNIDFVANSLERTKTFWNRKHVITSTPDDEGGVIDRLYSESDRRVWEVPCLACGAFSVYRFDHLRTDPERPREVDHRAWANRIEAGKVRVYYACPECGHQHHERDKRMLNAGGRWRAQGEEGPTVGFHLSSMASQLFHWKDMMAKWFRSQGDRKKLKSFMNQNLAQGWRESSKRADKDEVLRRLSGLNRGVVPSWTRLLTVGVDGQDWGFPYSVWAFGSGLRSRMVDHGVAPSLDEVHVRVMRREYGVGGAGAGGAPDMFGGVGGKGMSVMGGFVDSRWRTMEVNTWCARNPGARLCPIMGRRSESRSRERCVLSETQVIPDVGGSIPLFMLDVNQYKDLIFQVFERDPGGPGAMGFHAETDFRFSREFTAEERVEARNARTGYTEWVWKLKAGEDQNHFFDTGVYAWACADYMGLMNLGVEGEERVKGEERGMGNGESGMGSGRAGERMVAGF